MAAEDHLSKKQFMSIGSVGKLWSADYPNVGQAQWISREHLKNPKDLESLKSDISKHGIKTPLDVSKDEGGYLVDGHHRYVAARELGLKQVPVKYVKFGA